MPDIRQILVPVDFSAQSLSALVYARELAAVFDARVDVLHVIEEAALAHVYGIEAVSPGVTDLATRTLNALHEMLDAEAGGHDGGVHEQVGHPAVTIVAYADSIGADLIVISSHGRTGFRRLVMGSVAESVVRTASCPILAVKQTGNSVDGFREERRVAVL